MLCRTPTLLIKGRIKKFHKFDIPHDMFMCIFNIRHHNPTSKEVDKMTTEMYQLHTYVQFSRRRARLHIFFCVFWNAVGDQGQPAQLQHLEVIARDDESLPNYHALLDEILCVVYTGTLNLFFWFDFVIPLVCRRYFACQCNLKQASP